MHALVVCWSPGRCCWCGYGGLDRARQQALTLLEGCPAAQAAISCHCAVQPSSGVVPGLLRLGAGCWLLASPTCSTGTRV